MWPEPAGELGALELGELLCEELVPDGKSGVERQLGVGDLGDKLWVGDAGKLSPEDRERFKQEKLRLV